MNPGVGYSSRREPGDARREKEYGSPLLTQREEIDLTRAASRASFMYSESFILTALLGSINSSHVFFCDFNSLFVSSVYFDPHAADILVGLPVFNFFCFRRSRFRPLRFRRSL